MTSWPSGIGAVTLFQEDLEAAKEFYGRAFDVEPIFEDADSVVFRFGPTMINLLRTAAAHDLVGPAAVAAPGAGVRAQYTLDVDDVDAVCARLTAAGVALLNGPVDRPWGIRTASFADPGGHIWEIAH